MKIVIFLAAVSAADVFVGVEGGVAIPKTVISMIYIGERHEALGLADAFQVSGHGAGISEFEFYGNINKPLKDGIPEDIHDCLIKVPGRDLWISHFHYAHPYMSPGEKIYYRTKIVVNGVVREALNQTFIVPTAAESKLTSPAY